MNATDWINKLDWIVMRHIELRPEQAESNSPSVFNNVEACLFGGWLAVREGNRVEAYPAERVVQILVMGPIRTE